MINAERKKNNLEPIQLHLRAYLQIEQGNIVYYSLYDKTNAKFITRILCQVLAILLEIQLAGDLPKFDSIKIRLISFRGG